MKCPKCLKNNFDENDVASYAISRLDNETKICTHCGNLEGFGMGMTNTAKERMMYQNKRNEFIFDPKNGSGHMVMKK